MNASEFTPAGQTLLYFLSYTSSGCRVLLGFDAMTDETAYLWLEQLQRDIDLCKKYATYDAFDTELVRHYALHVTLTACAIASALGASWHHNDVAALLCSFAALAALFFSVRGYYLRKQKRFLDRIMLYFNEARVQIMELLTRRAATSGEPGTGGDTANH